LRAGRKYTRGRVPSGGEVVDNLGPSLEISQFLDELDKISTELENARKSHVFLLIFHDYAYITREVVDDFEFFVKEHGLRAGEKGIDVILHTRGGDPDAAYHLGILLQNLIEENDGENKLLSFIVPRLAKSAGTLLACSGDVIAMTPISELGPLDPQVYVESSRTWISARVARDSFEQTLEILREIILKDAVKIISNAPGITDAMNSIIKSFTEATLSSIPIMELGDYDSLIDHVRSMVIELLKNRMFRSLGPQENKNVENIAETLVSGYKYHGKVIHLKEAKKLGLTIQELSDQEVEIVNRLYKKVRELFDSINKMVLPLETVVGRPPPITKYQLEHGLIYAPQVEE
jgi:hypothetical protein